ncbi:MAG: hypothetical protein HWN81_00385 [Candidatus Lokiarchaeota archaeon]|nr:hypothetical protein [Candidatus Lokiarchaeota archaeon]
MLKILIIIILMIVGIQDTPPKRGTIDKHFIPYIEQWNQDARRFLGKDYKMPTITIVFGKVDAFKLSMAGRPIGVCSPIPFDRFIMIDREYWDTISTQSREQLLFHELAHCTLSRLFHTKDMISEYRPISIMHPYLIMSGTTYYIYREYYIKELFTKNIGRTYWHAVITQIKNLIY